MTRWGIVLALALVCALAPAAASAATVPADAFGALGDLHVTIPGATGMITSAQGGDANGDGREDTAVQFFDSSGGVWVTFSPETLPVSLDTSAEGWTGMHITGARLWTGVKFLGDVNGDGRDEIVVQELEGDLVVVFGRADGGTVDLANLGDGGFRIRHVRFGTASGYGSNCCGIYLNTTMAPMGDQNGDGRPDLAFRDEETVKVAYTPADPAGAELDAAALGDHGFTLDTGAPPSFDDPFVSVLDDLNGDGRRDLAVTWTDHDPDDGSADTHIVGALSPGAGETVDLRAAPDSGKAFALEAPGTTAENAISLGDQNGDGRRDLALVIAPSGLWQVVLAYAPELGTRRTILPVEEGVSEGGPVYNGDISDVGDQDGDGRPDIAFSDYVRFSSTGSIEAANPAGPGGGIFLASDSIIVGSLADRNADGKRELMAVRTEDGPASVFDVFLSAPTPVPEEVEEPVDNGETVEFSGTFVTAPEGGTRSLGARATVEVTQPDGDVVTVGGAKVLDASGRLTKAAVRTSPRAAGLVAGRTYRYRMLLENGRGLVGASRRRSFTWRPYGDTPLADRLFGGAKADQLRGLGGDDVIFGRAGDDLLLGGDGADRLYGELGDDLLVGGADADRLYGGQGRDRMRVRDGVRDEVQCGPGTDRVRADRLDVLHDCEHVDRS